MNCLILVALLLCCTSNGGNGNGRPFGCLGNGGCGNSCDSQRGGRDDGCGCGNSGRRERQGNDDCGCRPDFRPEPRFEQRPFLFNQGADCGCEEPQNNGCDCDR